MWEIVQGVAAESDAEEEDDENDLSPVKVVSTPCSGSISLVSNTLCPDLSTHTLHQVDSLICVDEIANLVHTRIAMDNAATIRLPPTSKDAHLRAAELITKHGPWLWTT